MMDNSESWSAMIEYDQRRCGYVGIVGLKSREEAIEWLEKVFDWKRCWFLKPSMYIERVR